MKASDYLKKYGPMFFGTTITEENGLRIVNDIFMEFANELMSIACIRHIRLDSALDAAIEEQNGKWNSLVRLFQKKYGDTPIKKDGFRNGINLMLKNGKGNEQ